MRIEALDTRHAALVFDDLQDRALYAYIPDEVPASLDALISRYARYMTGAPNGERWLNWIAFDGDTPVGHVQATVYDDARRADVAWLIFPRYWRRGFGAAAVRAMLAALPDDVVTCTASIDPRNAASLALAHALGFVVIGTRDDGDVVLERAQLNAR